MSLVEGLGAYLWPRQTEMGAGAAHTIGNFGDFGAGWAGEVLRITRSSNSRLNSAAFLAGADNEIRILGGLLLAGSAVGTWGAHRMLDGRDFSVGEGFLVELGTVAGGLVGMGVAVLPGPEEIDNPTALFTLGALGA